MKKILIKKTEHQFKKNKPCPYIEPNIIEDALFIENDEVVGFYLKDVNRVNSNINKILNIANSEFRSKRVPKTNMARISDVRDSKNGRMKQYSTIIGSIPPKPVFKRHYPTVSSVHSVETAHNFIKAMKVISLQTEKIIEDLMPKQYAAQYKAMGSVDSKWRFGNLFTSSISNFNISANFHVDTRNIKNTVNAIYTKRKNSKGGCLHVPDYNLTIEQADNSLLVYPAWKDMHGVTPIIKQTPTGYRNSFIFYPLRAFLNTVESKDKNKDAKT